MAAIFYTCTTVYDPTHFVDDVYSFDINVSSRNIKKTVKRTEHKSISGHVETWVAHKAVMLALQTIPIKTSDPLYLIMWEFLDSCLGGESFSLDLYGTVEAEGSLKSMALTSKEIVEIRHPNHPQYFSFPFNVREII